MCTFAQNFATFAAQKRHNVFLRYRKHPQLTQNTWIDHRIRYQDDWKRFGEGIPQNAQTTRFRGVKKIPMLWIHLSVVIQK